MLVPGGSFLCTFRGAQNFARKSFPAAPQRTSRWKAGCRDDKLRFSFLQRPLPDRAKVVCGKVVAETLDSRETGIRHGDIVGLWFDYLLASKKEVKQIIDGTGWKIARFIESRGAAYAIVIEKQ